LGADPPAVTVAGVLIVTIQWLNTPRQR